MRSIVLQKRRDHDTSLVGAAAFVALAVVTPTVLPVQPALAQAPCTTIADDAERLACYDRALRGPAQTAPAPQAAPAPNRAESPTAAPAPARTAAPAATPAPAPLATERRERTVRESAAPTARTAPSAGNSDEPEIIPIVIVGVRALPGRETTFTASDGTSWVQTDSQRIVGLPDAPFDAEIKPGAMGSYFLLPADGARAIRVRQQR
jgi:hypothetical protein